MEELKIVAVIVVKKEFQNELVEVFQNLVNETRKEEGNVSYDLHQDTSNPLKYVILEVWKSDKAVEIHNASAHFEMFKQAIDGKIDGLTIDVVKKVY